MISFLKKIINTAINRDIKEIKDWTRDPINFMSEQNIVGAVFNRIFKSQESNIDTIASFAAHVINMFLIKFGANDEDTGTGSQLLTGPASSVKGDGGSSYLPIQKKRLDKQFEFVKEHMVNDLVQNRIHE